MWDSVIYEFPGYETLPMDQENWEYYTKNAERLEKLHPVDTEKEKVMAFADWANESLEMSEQFVYPTFVEG